MGIEEELKDLKNLLQKDKEEDGIKEKKFKFPFGKKVGRGQKKKNYVTVMTISENGVYDFKKYQIENQTILHEKIPRLAGAKHVMFDKKGNPLIVLFNWSVAPLNPSKDFSEEQSLNPQEEYQKSLTDGTNTKGYQLLMARMQSEQTNTKKQMGGILKWVVGLGVAALVIYVIATSGGGA